jgi:kynurenine formamidase
MRIDLSVELKEEQWNECLAKRTVTAFGHLGTHIDVMNKEFPLENAIRRGKVVDVSLVRGRDIETSDADFSEVSESDFVMLHTGYLNETGSGSDEYSGTHPQLSR